MEEIEIDLNTENNTPPNFIIRKPYNEVPRVLKVNSPPEMSDFITKGISDQFAFLIARRSHIFSMTEQIKNVACVITGTKDDFASSEKGSINIGWFHSVFVKSDTWGGAIFNVSQKDRNISLDNFYVMARTEQDSLKGLLKILCDEFKLNETSGWDLPDINDDEQIEYAKSDSETMLMQLLNIDGTTMKLDDIDMNCLSMGYLQIFKTIKKSPVYFVGDFLTMKNIFKKIVAVKKT